MQTDLTRLPSRPTDDNLRNLDNIFGQGTPGLFRLGAFILAAIVATVRSAFYVKGTLTRPSDSTAYASGDLVANSVTAGSVVPIPLKIARNANTSAIVKRVRLSKSGTTVSGASFRVHLYSTLPTVANGDNAAWSSSLAGYLGALDVTVDKAFTDGAAGFGVPNVGTEINLVADADATLFALIEARGTYTPASAEVFTITLEGSQS